MKNPRGTLTVKVHYFCGFAQTDALPLSWVECFNELLDLCLPKVRPCSPGYTIQIWRICAHPRVEGLLALRNGQWEKQGCATTVEGKAYLPISFLLLGIIPTNLLQQIAFNFFYTRTVCHTWNDSNLSQDIWSHLWHCSLMEGITSLSYRFLTCQPKWKEVICSSPNHVQPWHMALGAEDRKTCMPILLNSHVGSPEHGRVWVLPV